MSAQNALATACAALSAGQSASFAPGTQHNMDSPSGATASQRLDWQARFFHDTTHGLVHLLGKSASSQGGSTDWRHRIYNIAENLWFNVDHNFNRSGHIYASFDIDPATGNLYGAPGSDSTDLWRWQYATQTWSQIASNLAGSGPANPPHGCAWHPNLYGAGSGGLVTITQTSGSNNSLCYYRASNGAVERTYLAAALAGTNPQGCYFPAIDGVVIGRATHAIVTPNSGGTPSWANAGSPPIETQGTASGVNCGVAMPHPNNSAKLLLLEKLGTSRYWTSTDGDSWTQVGTHPFPNSPDNPITLCSLGSGLGCVWGIGVTGSTLHSTLWQPAP